MSDKNDTSILVFLVALLLGPLGIGLLVIGWMVKAVVFGIVGTTCFICDALGKGTRQAIRAYQERSPRPKKPPSRGKRARQERRQMYEAMRIIDSLPLDKEEKEAAKEQARRKMLKELWELMK